MPDIVIKKVKKGGHGGHHGGSWKVAYADFVTAMMAFFLLLWLLSSASDEQLKGISNYFAPVTLSQSTSGSGGILGGQSIAEDGSMRSDKGGEESVSMSIPPQSISQDQTQDQNAELRAQAHEEKQFTQAEQQIRQAIESTPDIRDLIKNIRVEETDEGLRIQILDEDGTAMFPSGSAQMKDHTRQLLSKVEEVIKNMPQHISIEGHTDAVPFRTGDGYTNWELSSDRALATRRQLEELGLPSARFSKVAGLADTDPLIPDDPTNERNRRISITLLRGTGPKAAADTGGTMGGATMNGGSLGTPAASPAPGTNAAPGARPGFSVPASP